MGSNSNKPSCLCFTKVFRCCEIHSYFGTYHLHIRFEAFTVEECNKIFLGHHLHQCWVVLNFSEMSMLRMLNKEISETLVFNSALLQIIASEYFRDWRFLSSGIQRCVVCWNSTDILEDRVASDIGWLSTDYMVLYLRK
jgi:hypothetical protein